MTYPQPVRLHVDTLAVGEPLSSVEFPVCCDVLMDGYRTGYQCGQCDRHLTIDRNRMIIHISGQTEHHAH